MAANNDWTRENLAWVAGLFEGEGCISSPTKARAHQWYLVVASTDLDVIERLQNLTGVGNITGPVQRSPKHKPCWTWRVTKREHVYALLVAIYPWLGQRRQERARECLVSINEMPTYASRRCERGHPWSPKTTAQRPHDGGHRVVCLECWGEGVVSHRMGA